MRFVKIIHPESGGVAEVPESALPHHYRAGWAPLDETPDPEDVKPPAPLRASAVRKAKSKEGE